MCSLYVQLYTVPYIIETYHSLKHFKLMYTVYKTEVSAILYHSMQVPERTRVCRCWLMVDRKVPKYVQTVNNTGSRIVSSASCIARIG